MTICRENETSLKWYHSKRFKMKFWNCRVKKMNHVYLKVSVCRDEKKIVQCEKYLNIEKWVFQHLFTSSVWIRYLLSAIYIFFHFFFICANFCNGFYKLFNDSKWRIASVFQHGFSCVFFCYLLHETLVCLFLLFICFFFFFILAVCGKRVAKNIITPISGPINDTFIQWEREHLRQWFWIETSKKDPFRSFHPFSSNNNLSGTFCLQFCRRQNWKISYDNALLLQNIQSGCCCRLHNKIKSI